MTKQDKIKYGIIGGTGFLVLILTIVILTTFKKKDEPPYRELIAAKDSTIAAKDETIRVAMLLNEEKDKNIAAHERSDSLLLIAYKDNQPRYIPIQKRYESIPVTVRSYSKDSLRWALSRY